MTFPGLPPELYLRVLQYTWTLDRVGLRKTSKAVRKATDLGFGIVVLGCAQEGRPRVVDLQACRILKVVRTPKSIRGLRTSGSVVAVVVKDRGLVLLSDVATGEIIRKTHENVSKCVFSHDGSQLATMSGLETKFWNLTTNGGTLTSILNQSDIEDEIELYSDEIGPVHIGGTFLRDRALGISGQSGNDGFSWVTLRDARTGKCVMSYNYLINFPDDCVFSPRGDWVAIFLQCNSFVLARISDDLSEICRLLVFYSNGPNTFSFSPDGTKIAIGSKATLYIADLSSVAFAIVDHLENPDDDYPNITLDCDQPWFSKGMEDIFVPLRDEQQGKPSRVTHCSFSPDSQLILAVRGTHIHLYDVKTGSALTTVDFKIQTKLAGCHFLV